MPARSQPTIVSVGASVPEPCRFAAFVQSKAANFALTSAVTPATGVAFGSAVPVEAAVASTWRKRSSAVCPTNSTTRRPVSPGTEITIWRLVPLPCAATSDSATPSEFTRWRIMDTAWSMASLVTLPFSPAAIRGCKVTDVPPRRSRPRRTDVAA